MAARVAACFVALGVFATPAHAADGPNLHGTMNQLSNEISQLSNDLGVSDPKLPPVNVALPQVNANPGALVGAVAGTSVLPGNASSSGSSAATAHEAAPAQAATATPRASIVPSPRVVRRGELRPTGPTAVLHLARSATVLLVLLLGAVGFLVVQSNTERRNPRLVAAPIDRRDSELEFR